MSKLSNRYKDAVALAGSGQEIPALDMVGRDPGMAALLSKLLRSRIPHQHDQQGNITHDIPQAHEMRAVSDRTAQNISDAQTVVQMLPDLELAAQVLISSILAPKDMVTTELSYQVPDGTLPPEIAAQASALIREYFEQDYKIKPLLPRILRDVLFETGSWAVAVLPESSIDEIINSNNRISRESLAGEFESDGAPRPVRLLGPARRTTPEPIRTRGGFSLESINHSLDLQSTDYTRMTLESELGVAVETYTTVIDNFDALKIPSLNARLREQKVLDLVYSKKGKSSTALESMFGKSHSNRDIRKMSDKELEAVFYRPQFSKYVPVASLKTQEQIARHTIGEPLVLHLPSESVLPAYVPGMVEKHVGYYVLIDGDGNPISRSSDVDYYKQLNSRMNSGGNFASAMLTKLKNQVKGFDINTHDGMNYSFRAYQAMVEKDLLDRLRNGVYGNGVALARREEIYRIMFARTLQQQATQVLFIPIELMTYFALRYNQDGVGKSLLEDMKILNSMRSMLMFSSLMAAVKNSISRTDIKVKLDEDDPDPRKTMERMYDEIVELRSESIPIGTNNPMDIVSWIKRAGYEISFEGHPGLPDITVDMSEKATQYARSDTELESELRKRSIMSMGLSPDTVDSTFQPEFATSVVTNNILLSKRVVQIQEEISPHLNDMAHKIALNSQHLYSDIRKLLEERYEEIAERAVRAGVIKKDLDYKSDQVKVLIIDHLTHVLITGFEISLPKPNSVTLENQLTAFETYKKGLDAVLEVNIDSSFFSSEIAGDVSQHVDAVKQWVKAAYCRRWLAENGVMPEISELVTTDETGKPLFNFYDEQLGHAKNLIAVLGQFMNGLSPIKNAANLLEQKRQEADSSANSTPPSNENGDMSSDDGGTGGDDFDIGDDFDNAMGGSDNNGADGNNPPDDDSTPDQTPDATPDATTDQTPAGQSEETPPEDKSADQTEDKS